MMAIPGSSLPAAVTVCLRIFSRTSLDEPNREIRVGLPNQPPYNGLSADGAVGGFVPAVTELIMEKLGVPKGELQVDFCVLVGQLYLWQFP
jgi:hypothetical protein